MRFGKFVFAAALLSAGIVSSASAQDTDYLVRLYVTGLAGVDLNWANTGGYNETVNQATGAFVTGSGTVIVPATSVAVPADKGHSAGALFGGKIGADLPLGNGWLVGLQGEYTLDTRATALSYTSKLAATAITPATTVTIQRDISDRTTTAANLRFGRSIASDMFLYGIGGIALTDVNVRARDSWNDPGGLAAGTANFAAMGPVVTAGGDHHALLGWTAGLGAENTLSNNVTVGLEYRHTDFGTHNYTFSKASIASSGASATDDNGKAITKGQAVPAATKVTLSDDRVMVDLNYYFVGL